MIDGTGREIHKGDVIIVGSDSGMSFGVVEKLTKYTVVVVVFFMWEPGQWVNGKWQINARTLHRGSQRFRNSERMYIIPGSAYNTLPAELVDGIITERTAQLAV